MGEKIEVLKKDELETKKILDNLNKNFEDYRLALENLIFLEDKYNEPKEK
jgi:hypothetical protein